MSKKYELELRSLPFSKGDNQVIYVESEFNPAIDKFIESHIEEIKAIFAEEFLDFCYVPEVCERFWEMGELDWYRIPYDKRLLRTYGTHLRTDEVFNHEVRVSEIEPSFICNERGVSLGDRIAAHYIIKKNDAGIYKIALPEDMVSYESKAWDFRCS